MSRYSSIPELSNLNTAHSLAILSVPEGSTVLDVGSADGSVARVLRQRGCRVWAIEQDEDAASAARQVCEHVEAADVETLDLHAAFGSRCFDVVLLLDVLEHLKDPRATLKRVSTLLGPHGRIIISIPNVTHGSVRVRLMQGIFRYTPTGLLDETHLRFFDRQTAERLVRDTGLVIVERLRVSRELTETEIPVDPSALPRAIVEFLEADPEAKTYQFVFVAKLQRGRPVSVEGSLAERLQTRTLELETQYRNLEAAYRALESLLERERHERTGLQDQADRAQHRMGELTSELEARVRELHQRDHELRHLIDLTAIKEAFISELRAAHEHALQESQAALADRTEQVAAQTAELAACRNAVEVLQTSLQDEQDRNADQAEQVATLTSAVQAFQTYCASPGIRMADQVARTMARVPVLYRPVRGTLRYIAGWLNPP